MRIWKGIEQEHNGNFGISTLFVESENPCLPIIENILNNDRNINVVYFGAGEIDITDWKFISDLQEFKMKYGVDVVLECSLVNLPNDYSVFDKCVIRIAINNVLCNAEIKLRTKNTVYICGINRFKSNSINSVVDGMYSEDILLYDEED